MQDNDITHRKLFQNIKKVEIQQKYTLNTKTVYFTTEKYLLISSNTLRTKTVQ